MKTESRKMVPDPSPVAKRRGPCGVGSLHPDRLDSGVPEGPRPIRGEGLAVKEGKARGMAGASAERQFRLLADRAPIVLWTTDRELRFTSSAGGGLARLGLQGNQVVGTLVAEYFGSEDAGREPLAAHRAALAGESAVFEFSWEGGYFQTYVEPLRGANGEVEGTVGIALDITELRRAERAQQS